VFTKSRVHTPSILYSLFTAPKVEFFQPFENEADLFLVQLLLRFPQINEALSFNHICVLVNQGKTMLKKSIFALGLMMGLSFAAMPAEATPVSVWTWTLDNTFSSYQCDNGGTGCVTESQHDNHPEGGGNASHLAWGCGGLLCMGPQSSLDLGGTSGHATANNLHTDGAAVATVSVVANNNVITGSALSSATIHDVLQLQAFSPSNPLVFTLPALDFDIAYDETDNGGNCISSQGSDCADIFALKNITGGAIDASDPNNIFISQSLTYLSENYTVELFISNMVQFTSAQCALINADVGPGVPPTCFGFVSSEGSSNQFNASLKILSDGPVTQVPEPVTLSLFGAGLAGAAFARRRKSKKA
jgi:hypothetical protein